MIDIEKAKHEFDKYVANYNPDDIQIALKIRHIHRVTDVAKKIAIDLKLGEEDFKLAELIALLHDIGRFEQVALTNTFKDKEMDHAENGVKVLFDEGLIRSFIKEDTYDEIIRKAVRNHNKLKILDDVTEKEKVFVNIIRDADKMDIFRVRKTDYKNEFILPPSTTVLECIKEEKSVSLTDIKNKSDSILCVLAFIFDFNFKESFILLKELGYYHELLDTIEVSDENSEIFNKIKERLLNKFEV